MSGFGVATVIKNMAFRTFKKELKRKWEGGVRRGKVNDLCSAGFQFFEHGVIDLILLVVRVRQLRHALFFVS